MALGVGLEGSGQPGSRSLGSRAMHAALDRCYKGSRGGSLGRCYLQGTVGIA